MWPSRADEAANPRDLNIFGGLPFDERFEKERETERKRGPFLDEFACHAPMFKPRDWRGLEGLDLIFWHMRFVLCNGEAQAFAYLVQWFAFVLQKRRKPTVLVMLYSAPGVGKSAIVGENPSGPGILPRVYGRYYQQVSDIDHLLKDFNFESANKLFCCMEEATPYRKAHRNNDKLNHLI